LFTLIKGADVYSPNYLGKRDVLFGLGRIISIETSTNEEGIPFEVNVINADGQILVPGFIDMHVHITGGGGEGGFATRAPEISSSELLSSGITTVVGVLGTDGVTRSLENLYAKAKALEEEGLSTYIYTGSYQVPVLTFTGNVQRDLLLIDKVIGVGEISIADHRSFHPSVDELARLSSEARVGGMLSGKAGIVHLHLGDDERGLDILFDVLEKTSIPVGQFIPTHINRKQSLLEQSVKFGLMNGTIDLTAGFYRDEEFTDCIPSYEAFKFLMGKGVSDENITISSDSNGSMPVFDKNGNLVGIDVGKCGVLFADIRTGVLDYKLPLEKILKTVTINPATKLKLDKHKGRIAVGMDADLIMLDKELSINKVFAKGMRYV
jgi:beta-aspartyl-dipeptidase (metallo-type)